MNGLRILVTGAAGYIGALLIEALAERAANGTPSAAIVATDVREAPAGRRRAGVRYVVADVREPGLDRLLREYAIDTVVHLAAIVTPPAGMDRAAMRAVDVLGTRNVIDACVAAGVSRLIVTSSGAAYGYHADNPEWIDEDQPLRGNPEFAYADHKREVEAMLADARTRHPGLRQLVLRVCTILGEHTSNQITALFERPRLLSIRGARSPFVFVWDRDVVGAILHGIDGGRDGVFNLAGDGAMSMRAIAEALGKPLLELPAWLVRGALAVLHPLGLSRYGPEQVDFLRYRPALSNRRLKAEFGYIPRLDSSQVFDLYRRSHRATTHRPPSA